MFTGIVQARGQVEEIEDRPFGKRLVIDRSSWRPQGVEPTTGDSVCISGACLTVVEAGPVLLHFDVVAETLSKTTLGYLKKGDQVNLEPPVTPAQPMGGHFVLGHVDGVGKVIDVQGESVCKWTICPPSDLLDDIVPRGSIAVEGVSMTVAEVGREVFQVALIPTTLELTTLGCYQVGRDVNLETDIISKTIVHLMHRRRLGNDGPVTKDLLREAGLIP